jgi:hypothetical protein
MKTIYIFKKYTGGLILNSVAEQHQIYETTVPGKNALTVPDHPALENS